jgi:hypothetical protein
MNNFEAFPELEEPVKAPLLPGSEDPGRNKRGLTLHKELLLIWDLAVSGRSFYVFNENSVMGGD